MRNVILLFLVVLSVTIQAQVNAGPDQTICTGETTTLQGSGQIGYTYQWTSVPNDLTISNPNSLTPTVQPSGTTTYTLEGRSVSLNNSVVNGHFGNGNTGFTSSYTYNPGPNGLWNPGTYAITDDSHNNHDMFWCDEDHTTGSGYFMAVNGSQTANVVVWTETINNIDPNTDYEFSTWISSIKELNPARLQFSINNVLLGNPFQASSDTCEWFQFFEEWNSGSATSAVISIVNQNTVNDGNDFSLDDISFSKVSYFYDECVVTVNPIPTSAFDLPSETCSNDTTVITYTGNASISATYTWDFDGASIISGTGQGPYELLWPSGGFKSVSLYVEDACFSDTTTQLISVLESPVADVSADATSIAFGTSTILHGVMNGGQGTLDFIWDPAADLQNSGSQNPETILLQNSTLFRFTVTDQSTFCNSYDTITIRVTGGPLTLLSIVAQPDTICLGDSTDLSLQIEGGSGNYSLTWTSDPPGFNYIGSEQQITVGPSVNTTYNVEVSDGFTTLPASSVSVAILPQVDILSQPTDTLIEVNTDATFTVTSNNSLTYQWQVNKNTGTWENIVDNITYSGSQTPTLAVTNASASMNGYLFRCLVEGRCDPVITDDALLTVIDSPVFACNLEDIQTCETDTISIPCYISNFYEIDSMSLTFDFNNGILEYLDFTSYHTELSSLGVSSTGNSVSINWSQLSGLTLSDGIFFDFTFVTLSQGSDSLLWSPDSKVRNSYGFYPELSVTSSDVYILPQPVTPDIIAAIPDSLNILDEEDINLEATGGIGDYIVWFTGGCNDDTVGTGSQLSVFRPDETTYYYAANVNQCGTSACDSVKVIISEEYFFSVPNAFTPDGDGKNDKFGVVTTGTLASFDFRIFTRWGQQIFITKDQYELWDGTFNSEKVPQGTYIWKVTYKYRLSGKGSEEHSETGVVTAIY